MTSTVRRTKTGPQAKPLDEQTLGQLVAGATQDISLLMKQEVELAKLEIKNDVIAAGKGAGAFGGAGVAGLWVSGRRPCSHSRCGRDGS